MNGPFRGGMQVHAVPDDERVIDASTGAKLPWGYSFADPSLNKPNARTVRETGPFGKPTIRRSLSRASRQSRTVTPAGPSVDPDKLGMQKEQDAVFGEWRNTLESSAPRNRTAAPSKRPASFDAQLQRQSSRDLMQPGASPEHAMASTQATADEPPAFAEPTEVRLYGFLPSSQAAAIAFFESASRGYIYEDYDRAVANPRFAQSSILSQTNARRAAAAQAQGHGTGTSGLTQASLRRINEYKGGDHWIKVTFDSPLAAERAIEASPHLIGGCNVHAELWHGQPPREDVPIPAQQTRTAGTMGRQPSRGRRDRRQDFGTMPARMPAGGYGFNPADSASSTETAGASSNTVDASSNTLDASTSSATLPGNNEQPNGELRQRQTGEQAAPRKPKIKGARTITLQPKESALMPVVPLRVQLLQSIPILGTMLVGSTAPEAAKENVDEVKPLPRKEDGSVDWARAGWVWYLLGWLDWVTGTDICGLRED
ncbi:MAG: hypothetical protein Q9159_005022 [Coniocarpon cinnabarinum]